MYVHVCLLTVISHDTTYPIDLLVFGVIWGAFGLLVSKWPVTYFWYRIMWENGPLKFYHGSKWGSLNLKYIENAWSWSETDEYK